MRPTFNLEPQYRVTMLTREEWIRGPGTPSVVKWLVSFTHGSRMMEGTGAGVYGQSFGRRLSICLGNMLHFFRLKYMLSWLEIQMKFRPERYFSICSDSQATLKALQAAKTVFIGMTVPKGIE